MVRLFRARACCLITAILLAAGTTSTAFSELVHGGASHDLACASMSDVTHDASSHRVRSSGTDASHDPHCVGCHLARAPRAGAQPLSHVEHCDEASPLHPAAVIGSAHAAALDNLPPRAPPRHS